MKQFTITVLITICSICLKAQFVPMSSTFNTPMGPIHTTHYVYMPYNYGTGGGSPKYKFTVRLKNDSLITFKSKMLSEKKKMYVVYKADGEKIKIFPSDTKSLTNIDPYLTKIGDPVDSCWLFMVKMGVISCYSSVPTSDMSATIAVQKSGSPKIISLTKDNLREMVSDIEDEIISKWIEKGNLVKVIERYNEKKLSHP